MQCSKETEELRTARNTAEQLYKKDGGIKLEKELGKCKTDLGT